MQIITWTIILTLILVNALYVAAEFAAVSVRRSRIQQRAEEGDALARRLLPFIADPHRLDRYIAACQIGITLSSLVLGAYGQATLAVEMVPLFERFGAMQEAAAQSTAALVVLIGLTVLQMILGELVPKSIALRVPTQVALWTVIPMRWSLRLLSWFITILNGSGAAVLRLFGIGAVGHGHIHSPEEIELLIVESRKGGVFAAEESDHLRRALRLGVRPARELMVPRTKVEALDVESDQGAVLDGVSRSPYTRLPVYESSIDRIIGIVHVRDVALQLADGTAATSAPFDLRTLLRPVLLVPETITADHLLARMRGERRTMAILVDEFGGTAGLVTVDDILDELIGDVGDEFKGAEPLPERLPDGRVRLPGTMGLDAAAEWMGTHPDEDSDAHTVSGRILEVMGRVPAAGERVVADGVKMEIERSTRRMVESVLVTPISRGAPTDA